MELQDVIRIRRKELGLSLEQIAQSCGVGKSIVAKWERGDVKNIRRDNLAALADVLRVSPLVLMEREEFAPNPVTDIPGIVPLPKTYSVPLLGEIACGDPILAEQNIADQIPVPEHIKGADFALTCKGDSMINARIHDGDIVYIRQQPEVENGEIAAVLIENEATLKRVYKYPDKLVLNPENPVYPPMVYSGTELESIRILGKAIAFLSPVK